MIRATDTTTTGTVEVQAQTDAPATTCTSLLAMEFGEVTRRAARCQMSL